MLSLREKFLEKIKTETESNPREYQAYVSTLGQLEKFEAERGTKLEDGPGAEWLLQFHRRTKTRGYQTFAKQRSHLMAYLRFLAQQGMPVEETMDEYSKVRYEDLAVDGEQVYLKNLDTLRKYIDIAVQSKGAVDVTVYDPAAAILYLSWYGFTKDQMVELKKADVMESGVMLDGKLVEMEPFVMQVIHRYCESDGYYKESKGLTFHKYKESEYLFRSTLNAQLNDKNLRDFVLRLVKDTGLKILSIKVVYDSGIFFRMFVEENFNNVDFRSVPDEELAKRLNIKLSRSMLSAKLKDYSRFKEMF